MILALKSTDKGVRDPKGFLTPFCVSNEPKYVAA